MKSYEINPVMALVDVKTRKVIERTGIEPKPGEVIDFGGTKLMAVEDNEESCKDCAVHEGNFQLCMENSKKKCICLSTSCDAVFRKDGRSIHYEEVKDGQ